MSDPKTNKQIASNFLAAASHNILERGRCNSNAREAVSPTHTPHRAARFAFIRFSRADLRVAASCWATSSPDPKNISFGVCPSSAECGMTRKLRFLPLCVMT